ncbi:MAG: transposase [Acidimicrobiaceae bacterium]|nr:transposase [Acidimicrobiaceae bacterium]
MDASMLALDAPGSVEAAAVSLRWPDGQVICPLCGETRVTQQSSGARRCWRCKRCRRRFTVTTGTKLHASKLALSDWWAAAHAEDDGTAGMVALLGVSRATAGRVSRILRGSGMPPGVRRFSALLESGDASPSVGEPWAQWSEAQRRVFSAVRSHHLKGAGTNEIAHTASVSVGHVRRCLRRLTEGGFVRRVPTVAEWGYSVIQIRVWRLDFTEQTLAALMAIPYEPLPLRAEPPPTQVPPEFWSVFWSGTSADKLRLPEDGLLVAETMLSSRNQWARLWALQNAPLEALVDLRNMRGYTTGTVAIEIDLAIEQRSRA